MTLKSSFKLEDPNFPVIRICVTLSKSPRNGHFSTVHTRKLGHPPLQDIAATAAVGGHVRGGQRRCILILMKLVKLSSCDAFKFSPKELPSCMPKGLSFVGSVMGGLEPLSITALWLCDRTSSDIIGHKLQGCSRAYVSS